MEQIGSSIMDKQKALALKGGAPIRDADHPLPEVFPRQLQTEEHLQLVREIDESGLTAPVIDRFVQDICKAWGVRHAVPVTNCTAAVHVAVAALDLEPGDEVVVSTISDYGSFGGIVAENLTPVFADVDERTGNCTADDIEAVITDRTRAVVLSHFYGQVCDMDPILEVCEKHEISLIEDICQTPLVKYKGRISGTMGFAGTPAFSPEKTFTTNGGGMVITDDEDFARLCDVYANRRGVEQEVENFGRVHSRVGYNYRYCAYRAALGIANLKVFPEQLKRRMALGESLNEKLEKIEGITPCRSPQKEAEHGYWLYAFQMDLDRFDCTLDEMGNAIEAEGLKGCTPCRYYGMPASMSFLHKESKIYHRLVKTNPRLADFEYSMDRVPNARLHLEKTLRWCFTDKYTEKDLDDIAEIIAKVAEAYRKE